MAEVHIDEVYSKTDDSPVTIFPSTSNLRDCINNLHFYPVYNEKSGEKMLITEFDGMIFRGVKSEPNKKKLLLARNKTTSRVRMIELSQMELMPLRNLDMEVQDSQCVESSNEELKKKFGSKRTIQLAEHHEKLKANLTVVEEQLDNVMVDMSEDKLDLSVGDKSMNEEFYIPPINRNAEKVEDVYDVDKILTEAEYENIYSEIENTDLTSELLPMVDNIMKSRSLSKKQTVLVLYANCLLMSSLSVMKDMSKKSFKVCTISPTLNELILQRFFIYNNGRLCRSNTYKDKALCHAIVFLLIVNNFKINLDDLSSLMKMTAKTVITKIRATGAVISTSNYKKYAHLKLPLNFATGFRRRSTKF